MRKFGTRYVRMTPEWKALCREFDANPKDPGLIRKLNVLPLALSPKGRRIASQRLGLIERNLAVILKAVKNDEAPYTSESFERALLHLIDHATWLADNVAVRRGASRIPSPCGDGTVRDSLLPDRRPHVPVRVGRRGPCAKELLSPSCAAIPDWEGSSPAASASLATDSASDSIRARRRMRQ